MLDKFMIKLVKLHHCNQALLLNLMYYISDGELRFRNPFNLEEVWRLSTATSVG
jgi:hypothetical protein